MPHRRQRLFGTQSTPPLPSGESGSIRFVHGVPENFDYDVFVGAVLESVSFGAYIVHLNFSSEKSSPLYIAVEGTFVHTGPEAGGWEDTVRLPTKSSRLMQLTNHLVTAAARIDQTRMRIDFDHGHQLTLLDDTDQYESFQIKASGRFWVI
jgi:hypothetical protein